MLQKAFQVTCTLADIHHIEKGIKPNDSCFSKLQEQLSGATATIQYDSIARFPFSFRLAFSFEIIYILELTWLSSPISKLT